jgi:hypothetical protein
MTADDAIDTWHEFGHREMSVQDWLGWTRVQYEEWVMHGYGPPIKPDAPCMTHVHKSDGER